MNVYTITLNPAYDVHARAKELSLGNENLAEVTSRDAGGKGINISRALTCNGIKNTAIVVLGEDNCADFENALAADNITYIGIKRKGRIRENLTVHTDSCETRISFSGFTLDNAVLYEISKHIIADANTIVTFTGSVPGGIDMLNVKDFIAGFVKMGVKTVIDSKSFTIDDILEVKPWLIKPNEEEIAVYSGKAIKGFSDCVDFAKKLHYNGIENVMISLGDKGALLVTADGEYIAVPPRIKALSTVGAGDSSIAGFISACSNGYSPEECLRTAVAYGSAACVTEGTKPPIHESIAQIYKKISVDRF